MNVIRPVKNWSQSLEGVRIAVTVTAPGCVGYAQEKPPVDGPQDAARPSPAPPLELPEPQENDDSNRHVSSSPHVGQLKSESRSEPKTISSNVWPQALHLNS
jgi:hypothetical protein